MSGPTLEDRHRLGPDLLVGHTCRPSIGGMTGLAPVDEDLFSVKAQGLTTGAFNFNSPRIDETRLFADDVQIRGGFYNLFVATSNARRFSV